MCQPGLQGVPFNPYPLPLPQAPHTGYGVQHEPVEQEPVRVSHPAVIYIYKGRNFRITRSDVGPEEMNVMVELGKRKRWVSFHMTYNQRAPRSTFKEVVDSACDELIDLSVFEMEGETFMRSGIAGHYIKYEGGRELISLTAGEGAMAEGIVKDEAVRVVKGSEPAGMSYDPDPNAPPDDTPQG